MKNIWLILISVLFIGCYSFNPSIMKVDKSEIDTKLHRLEIGPNAIKVKNANYDQAIVNSDFVTILSRELEKNIFLEEEKTFGNIELVIAYEDWGYSKTGRVLAAFSGLTLTIINLFGVPENILLYELDIEINIYNNNGDRVKKYSFEKSKTTPVGPYYYNGGPLKRREVRIELLKECLRDFKNEVGKEVININKKLEM